MVNKTVTSNDEVNIWLGSSDSSYGGSSPLHTYFSVIIAVKEDEVLASNVLVSNMLHDIHTLEHGRIRVASCRPDGSVSLIENELIINQNVSSRSTIDMIMRVSPDIIMFDALFPFRESNFKGQLCPSQMGYRVFYFVQADGNNEEELRDSAIKNYLALTKRQDLSSVDRLIVSGTNNLDALEPFTFTEFSFQ